jgi:aryl-alcohol dehydrogenase-like predicted oxidoreductase
MQHVKLGETGLKVSRIGIGTAAFSLEGYGIPSPGEDAVDSSSAIETIRAAVAAGINFFDTAPGYGPIERLLGEALAQHPDCVVATKVPVPEGIGSMSRAELQRRVDTSLDSSRRALQRDVLDVVQIHNATVPVLLDGCLVECLQQARQLGKLRFIGASVYGTSTALEAIQTGQIEVLQLAVSMLDQRMCSRVLPEAEQAGIGVMTRSALLKGALTKRAQWLPDSLRLVAEASARAVTSLETTWEELPSMALRFCLSLPAAQTVLVGVRSLSELHACLAAEGAGALPRNSLSVAHSLALDNEQLLNPSFWQMEENDIEHKPV